MLALILALFFSQAAKADNAFPNHRSMAFTMCGALAGWPDLWKEDGDIDKWNTDSNAVTINLRQFDYDCVQVENNNANNTAKLATLMKKRDALANGVHSLETRSQDLAARIKATVPKVRANGNASCADQMARMSSVMQAHMNLIDGEAAGMCQDPSRPRRDPKADEEFD